jgi:predicted RNA-binding protein with RPS1 domain
MKVILKQSGRHWIDLYIETGDTCIIIHTCVTFDPYERLYILLGKVRDRQLPDKMIIDEEGYGVELIVEAAANDNVLFRVDPWMSRKDRITVASETLDRRELIKAFHDGIVDFVNNTFIPSNWSLINDISYQNWGALLQEKIEPQNWNKRLLISGFKIFPDEQYPEKNIENIVQEEDLLTVEQETILILAGVLGRIAIANKWVSEEIEYLANLYKTLPLNIILNEVDLAWYQEQIIEFDLKHGKSLVAVDRGQRDHYLNLRNFRLKSLKIGQVLDGTIVRIREYGVFVDFGGCRGLLHISEISHREVEHPNQIFKEKDWVRAIIIDLDVDRGRVTLSTRILESEAGDMHKEPWKVYEKAEEMADRYRQNVLSKIDDVD